MLSIITINSLLYYATLRFPPMRGFGDMYVMKIEKKKYNPPTPQKHPFPKIKPGTADDTPRVDRQG